MNDVEIAPDDKPEIAHEAGLAEPISSEAQKAEPPKSLFAELLKAIEHWVQTR